MGTKESMVTPKTDAQAERSAYIGIKIRRLREEASLTVTELASRVGLTTSMLSQVERTLVSPSLSSLMRIADALGVPPYYFLIEEPVIDEDQIVIRSSERATFQPSGYNANFQLLSPSNKKRLEMFYFILDPGEQTCDEPQSHEGEECLYVISGKLKVVIPGREVVLGTGDSIYFERSLPHQLINTGTKKLSVICAITPPS